MEVIWRQDCYQLPTGRTSFGFKDGIGQPAIEGSGMPGTNPMEPPIKAGEFILGYPDETGALPPQPSPEILGRNGTYIAFRKLHTRVAAYRQYLRANAASRQEETLLGAKMVGRWQSGAPLALCPDRDDPELGTDRKRNNRFLYTDDLGGFRCPAGAHARRANPRDSLDGDGSVNVRLHRMIRRGTSYGPPLPAGVLDDDGVDRGIVFVFVGTHLDRQFEFVKTQWLNDGVFIGAPEETGPPGRLGRRRRPVHHSPAAHPPPAAGRAPVCGHPWRRVLLRSGAYGPSTGSPGSRPNRPMAKEAGKVTEQSTGADRWAALGFGPPATGLPEPDQPVVVDYIHDGRVAVITLNRPAADNAITTEMGALLTEILETIAVRIEVRVAILTGAGDRAFSVGSDLRQRQTMTKEDWLRQRQDFDRTLYTLRQLRKPIFAAVNGVAYGGGSELAQSTDFIIASENATFGQPEAMIGLAAGGGSPALLPRLLPPGRAMQMLLTGDPITAQEAHRLGMVNEIHPQASPHGRGPADRREDREQLTNRRAGGEMVGQDRAG